MFLGKGHWHESFPYLAMKVLDSVSLCKATTASIMNSFH